jgi:hypothetical protein
MFFAEAPMSQEEATEDYRYIIDRATVVDGQAQMVGTIEFFNDHAGGKYHWRAERAFLLGITSSEARGVCHTFEEAKEKLNKALASKLELP